VLVVGESGNGKTHLATHTAVRLSDDGQLVLWVSADDYRKNELGLLLARAVGPYSKETFQALLQKATEGGAGVTAVVDALQACRYRTELLNQLNALLLAWPAASVLVTSQTDAGTELFEVSTLVQLCAPAGEERAALATSYGSSAGVADSEEFCTRFDIAMAAQVSTALPAGAARADVLDAYIGQLALSETVRAGLRCVAAAMDAEITSAITVAEAAAVLRRCPALMSAPAAIDDIMASRLIVVAQGRFRFKHERLARFLAAEALVVASADGAELGRVLAESVHRDLQDDALILERDPARRYEAIRQISAQRLFVDAARGAFGEQTSRQARADIAALLIEARAAVEGAVFEPPAEGGFFGHWHGRRLWSITEQALLGAAGVLVLDGMFIDEVCALLDATDEVLRAQMVALREDGHRSAISTVFAAAYTGQPRDPDNFAATFVMSSAYMSRSWSKRELGEAVASRVWADRSPSWGRLYLAAWMSWPTRHPEDARHLPDLIRTGWRLGGYHLQLELLDTSRYVHDLLGDEDRERMIEVLNEIDTQHNINLSTLHLEALARYGQIEALTTLADIQAAIAEVLSDVDDPSRQTAAQVIVGRIFDDEGVVGPYSAAIYSLPVEQRLDLYAMSVLAADFSMAYQIALKELADHAEQASPVLRRALEEAARKVRPDNVIRQEAVGGHLLGLLGWAKIAEALPAPAPDPEEPAEAVYAATWRFVDLLLFAAQRGEDPACALNQRIWEGLLSKLALPATAVFCEIRRAMIADYNTDKSYVPHELLVQTYPDELRRLMEWALAHREDFSPPAWPFPAWDVPAFVVETLGQVGDASTAGMLRHYLHDPDLGKDAVAAIRRIETRDDQGKGPVR
jgi:hypothetical protein